MHLEVDAVKDDESLVRLNNQVVELYLHRLKNPLDSDNGTVSDRWRKVNVHNITLMINGG